VRDGQRIGAGEPLFRQSGAGRSSWATFYDPGSPFQVVVSVQALPSGRDLDPLPLLRGLTFNVRVGQTAVGET